MSTTLTTTIRTGGRWLIAAAVFVAGFAVALFVEPGGWATELGVALPLVAGAVLLVIGGMRARHHRLVTASMLAELGGPALDGLYVPLATVTSALGGAPSRWAATSTSERAAPVPGCAQRRLGDRGRPRGGSRLPAQGRRAGADRRGRAGRRRGGVRSISGAVAAQLLGGLAAPQPGRTVFPELTAREHEILELVATGLTNTEIGRRLALRPKTVRNYVANVLAKIHAADRADAVLRARRAGLV
jgi:DNA-binding CsgD family transcriptional regulator